MRPHQYITKQGIENERKENERKERKKRGKKVGLGRLQLQVL
jgi:hypothetical protein